MFWGQRPWRTKAGWRAHWLRRGGAELGRPGEVEEVVVEGLRRGGFAGLALRDGCG